MDVVRIFVTRQETVWRVRLNHAPISYVVSKLNVTLISVIGFVTRSKSVSKNQPSVRSLGIVFLTYVQGLSKSVNLDLIVSNLVADLFVTYLPMFSISVTAVKVVILIVIVIQIAEDVIVVIVIYENSFYFLFFSVPL